MSIPKYYMCDLNKKELYTRSGGYSRIYKIELINGTRAILKQFKTIGNELSRHILHEISYLRVLKHPNIVPLLGVMMSPIGIIIPEYKCDMHQYILSPNENNTNKWMKQMASAVCYLHQHGIIHGDIKETNIFISHDGDAILGDFGLCTNDTYSKTIFTYTHRPIEMYLENEYSQSGDIWALGCVFVALLTGKSPYFKLYGDTRDRGLYIHNIDQLTNMGEFPSGIVPDRYLALITGMFRYDPSERFTANQVALSLCVEAEGKFKNNLLICDVTPSHRSITINTICTFVDDMFSEDYDFCQNPALITKYDVIIYAIKLLDMLGDKISSSLLFYLPYALASLAIKYLTDDTLDDDSTLKNIEYEIISALDFMLPVAEHYGDNGELITFLLFSPMGRAYHIDSEFKNIDSVRYNNIYDDAETIIRGLIRDNIITYYVFK